MSGAMLLVVCGDVQRRDSFVTALRQAGWREVLTASTLTEATKAVRDAPNTCLIVDAELADMPGPQAVGILRKLCPHGKIIFTTPQNTLDLETQVRAMDVFYYYINSADRAELIAAVKDAIGAPRLGGTRPFPIVLIVDDDRDFQAAFRILLESAGYRTVSAYSQTEGLALARREKPDAILLDIIMGSTTDGFEFCHEVRRDPQIKHVPIVGISAIEKVTGLDYPLERDRELFPVDAYLRKPVEPRHLFAELRRLLPRAG